MRDLKAIGVKFWHVLYPKQSKALLKECKLNHDIDTLAKLSTFCLLTKILFTGTCGMFLYLKKNVFDTDPHSISGDLWGPLILCVFMAM